MAKELPYFKFEPNQWENGNIQLCSFEAQGVFINVCSVYWQRLGDLPYKLAVQKICSGNATPLDSLIDEKILKVIDGLICIDFLNEQLSEFENTSHKNSENARSGWEKRRLNATALPTESDRNAIRGEERREKERKEVVVVANAPTITDKSSEFYKLLVPYVGKYGKDTVREFYEYWTEKSKTGKKLRFEDQKFFDVSRRLATWDNRRFKKPSNKTKSGLVK